MTPIGEYPQYNYGNSGLVQIFQSLGYFDVQCIDENSRWQPAANLGNW